ncbi:S8 family serine peptidase [Actinospica durhamensis]|uniref:S8 family serine peptidase n=1 Tax=Actinospica durhamensis TaxID=1508375 RepID=A0A941EVN7_9ACTN|nr:S8 family serine peptidase [Actinospica durhamensis]
MSMAEPRPAPTDAAPPAAPSTSAHAATAAPPAPPAPAAAGSTTATPVAGGPATTRAAALSPAPQLTWRLLERGHGQIPISAEELSRAADPAFSGARGRGVRVCIVDSGVEGEHPLVGEIKGSWAVVKEGTELAVRPVEHHDACGHGTACASVVRRVAPECEIYSVKVLGERFSGTGAMLLAGLRWAVEQGFDVINMSLSTTRTRYADELRALTDQAFFQRSVIVASAHNTPVESFPWRFSSVISVGSHGEDDADLHLYNPNPPVEFFAKGNNVQVGWLGGSTLRTTGNSFATPYIAGLCARILSKYPKMTVFQVKGALYLAAANVHVDHVRGTHVVETGGAPS